MSPAGPRLIVHTDAEHGVARYARHLADAARRHLGLTEVAVGAFADLPRGTAVHLQFTDRLWGPTPEDAARAVAELARDRRVLLTLHDVPQASDGTRLARRVACYRQVMAAAALVVVNSRHERTLLAEHVATGPDPHVIPLPVDPAPAAERSAPEEHATTQEIDVAVLGFFYPGKGHQEAVDVAAELGLPRVSVLGRPSAGHEAELAALVRSAADRGVAVEVTGFLPDAELARRCRRSVVPLLAHRHVSASGSLATWLSLGRRPVALDGPYMREMEGLRPGTLTLTSRADLTATVARVLRETATTHLPPGPPPPWDTERVIRAYARLWADVGAA